MTRSALAILAILAWASLAAHADPDAPADPDAARERHSALWSSAIHPAEQPYNAALATAHRKLELRTDAARADAVQVLDDAIELWPEPPQAYDLRGRTQLALHHWQDCARDLEAAHGRATRPDQLAPAFARDLGVCQARAGKLADAEATLANAVAVPSKDGAARAELWLRLGEVRVGEGKLDEAISAFDAAIAERPVAPVAALWQRAAAYDRERQPSQAEADVRAAMISDPSLTMIDDGVTPLIGVGERELMFGIAYRYATSHNDRVELALAYFRRYLAIVAAGPWRHRVEEHLRELSTIALPERLTTVQASTPVDIAAALKVVRAAMPKLRACAAPLPSTVFEVRITRTGPRAGPHEWVGFHAPLAGSQARVQLTLDGSAEPIEAATPCLQQVADTLVMAPIHEKEHFYQLSFRVIAP